MKAQNEFHMLIDICNHPDSPLSERSARQRIPLATLKRMLNRFRKKGIVVNTKLKVEFSNLETACSAIVGVTINVPELRDLERRARKGEQSLPYATEEELLRYVKEKLVDEEPYKGQIIVETGNVVMGSREFGMLLTVHAYSQRLLFDFVRTSLEKLEGITQTQTMMIACSY